jgi:8-oxo-dGTP diphosphatase
MAKLTTPKSRAPRLTKEVSVMAWILNEKGEVLLVRQATGRHFWTLPGGKVKRSEALVDALEREVKEETGLDVVVGDLISVMDRVEKASITLLFEAGAQRGSIKLTPNLKEIADLGFSSTLPENSSPSVNHFWSILMGEAGNSK